MTFSKIAFAVASVGAASLQPGSECTSSTTVNPCTSTDHPTGMTCVADKFDKKTKAPISGKCECPKESPDFVQGRCQGKGEQKINKCHAVDGGNKCHWEGDDSTGKCVLNSAVQNGCNKCTPPAGGPTWASCYGSWPEGKFAGCVAQIDIKGTTGLCTCPSADDPCSKVNDNTVNEASSIVMV